MALTKAANRMIDGAPVNVKDYGAVGDGVTDDTVAIQAAIDYCKTNNAGLSFEGGKTYVISSTLEWEGSDISIGSTSGTRFTIAPSSAVQAFDLQGQSDTPTASTTVSATMSSQDVTITVADATGIVVGQIVELKSDTLWYYDNRGTTYKGETHRVLAIDGTTITVDSTIVDDYTIPAETVTAKFYNPAVLTISDMRVEYAADSACSAGVGGSYLVDSYIANCSVKNSTISAFGTDLSINVVYENCVAEHINDSGWGYGASIGRSTYVNFRNCSFVGCRTGPDYTGNIPCRYGLVDGCLIRGDKTLYDAGDCRGAGTHGGAEFITFTNNTMTLVRTGILIRGSNCVVQNNRFYGEIYRCVSLQYGKDIFISGNTSHPSQPRAAQTEFTTPNYFLEVWDDVANSENLSAEGIIDVSNNSCRVSTTFIYLQNDQGTDYDSLYIRNNTAILSNSGVNDDVSFILGDAGNTGISGESVIRDNNITVADGTYVYLRDVVMWPRWCDGIDEYEITDTSIVADDGGGGALDNVIIKLNVSVNDKIAHVVGYVNFDVITAGTSVWISNMPTAYGGPRLLLNNSTGVQKLCYVTQTKWRIGDSTSDYTADFAVGAGYTLWVDVHYHVDLTV